MYLYVLYVGENMNESNTHISKIFYSVNGRRSERPEYYAVRQQAENVLLSNHLSNNKNIEIVHLANKYGFVVATTDLPKGVQGVIAYDESGQKKQFGTDYCKVIVIDEKLSNEEKRFVVAHELGHYLLADRSESSSTHIETRIGHDEYLTERPNSENEIDYFAACILMPHQAVLKELKNHLDTATASYEKLTRSQKFDLAAELSATFRVSHDVASRRIEEVLTLEGFK